MRPRRNGKRGVWGIPGADWTQNAPCSWWAEWFCAKVLRAQGTPAPGKPDELENPLSDNESTLPPAPSGTGRTRWRVSGTVFIAEPLDVLVYAPTRERAQEAAHTIGWVTHDNIQEVKVETCVEEPPDPPRVGARTITVWVLSLSTEDGDHTWTLPSEKAAKARAAGYCRTILAGGLQWDPNVPDQTILNHYFGDRVGNLNTMSIRPCQFAIEGED